MKLSMWTILDWLNSRKYHTSSSIKEGSPSLNGIRFDQGAKTKKEFLHIHTSGQTNYKTLVDNEVDSILIKEDDITLIYDEISNAFNYYNDWERNLLFCLINEDNLNTLLEIAHNVFQRPMFIKGDSSWAFAATPGYDNSVHPDWKNLEKSIISRTADFEAVKTVSLDPNFQFAFMQRYPIIIKSPFYCGNVLRANVWIDEKRVCEIIVLEYEKPFNQGEIHLLHVFSQFIEKYIQKNRSRFLTLSDISILFIEMLESNSADSTKLTAIRNTFNWDIGEVLVLLCVEAHAQCETPIVGVLRDTLINGLKNSCTFSYHSHIVSVIAVNRNGGYLTLSKQIEQLMPSGAFTWGVSYEFNSLERISEYYQQSLKVLKIAYNMTKRGATMYDVVNHCIKTELKKLPVLQTYVHPALRKLEENDLIHSTNYLVTLYQFLLCGCNYTNAAIHLNLHRNSLIYRISRIQEIINIDLDNLDNINLLLLSYLIIGQN